jgi:lipid A disaccharide synthetase
VWRTLLLQRRVQAALRAQPPHVAVLMDYPAVNIPLGRFLLARGVRIIYYIPPNEWLWNECRTASIVSMCDVVLCNYAVEAGYFARAGGKTKLVGGFISVLCSLAERIPQAHLRSRGAVGARRCMKTRSCTAASRSSRSIFALIVHAFVDAPCLAGHPLVDHVAAAPSRQQARSRLGLHATDTVLLLMPASRFQVRSRPAGLSLSCTMMPAIQSGRLRFIVRCRTT